MIRSFKDAKTETVASGMAPKGFPADILRVAIGTLTMIENAAVLDDLRSPPGNRLEALKCNGQGQHSIRIDDQWRVCHLDGRRRRKR